MMKNLMGDRIDLEGLEWVEQEGGATHFPSRPLAAWIADFIGGVSVVELECPYGGRDPFTGEQRGCPPCPVCSGPTRLQGVYLLCDRCESAVGGSGLHALF